MKRTVSTRVDARLQERSQLTRPDYVVYIPRSTDDRAYDRVNEHFLVFDGPDGSLMAVWTQECISPGKGHVGHIVFSRSDDEGVTWTPPRRVVGPRSPDDPAHMSVWAFPMVSRSGRIYVLYNQNQGVAGWILFHTGTMGGVYSDDNGLTWSEPQDVPMPASPFDDPGCGIPPEWIVWQKPMRDLSGGYIVGYSHWVKPAVAYLKTVSHWTEIESVCEFMRFTNVDDNPQPRNLQIRFSPPERALRVPHREYPQMSVAQEPSLVRLPDSRLFCVMRTCSGCIWWSQSRDDGETWCSPRPLLYKDHGRPLLNPVSCDPIYPLSDGRYVILYHNTRGGKLAGGVSDAFPRRPLFISVGEFRPAADQPLWFSEPRLLMDNDGLGPDGLAHPPEDKRAGQLSMYASFTNRKGNDVLWYPDSKFFLLGKRITPEVLAGLDVPGQ